MKLPYILLLGSLTIPALSGCVIHINGDDSARHTGSMSSVFGSFDISEGRQVRNISTVNGGVELADNVTAEDVETVNGGIEIGHNVAIRNAEVVNGDIEAGNNLTVEKDVETVNGDVTLGAHALIKDTVGTVNGDISLRQASVGGNVETVNGNIDLREHTVITGNIVYAESRSDWDWGTSIPTLRIDDTSQVHGQIILHRDVKLLLSNPELENKVIRQYPGA
ncbi:hypothetical protein OCL06_11980 [Alteromonas sp. ASW11-19]|uniref:Polymer-forming cytoskeletal protein n=1 Tax=Alteromonas salexigens TaxID=2982530 RepID=A0ABT2VQZ4_9ALTE|nr:hypothetical protein [Alteromonas salexigens]MCU7555308.1 hypothetical protein [Alteromonas salexigens]